MSRKLFHLILLAVLMFALATVSVNAQEANPELPDVTGDWVVNAIGFDGVVVRNSAAQTGEDVRNVMNGETVTISDFTYNNGQIWGRIARNQYIRLWDGEARFWTAAPTMLPTVMLDDELFVIDYQTYMEIEALKEQDEDAPGNVIAHLNNRFDLLDGPGGYPGTTGGWSHAQLQEEEVELEGPLFYYTDHFEQSNVPAGAVMISTAGYWGVYYVPTGVTVSLPEETDGGRWVQTLYVLEADAEALDGQGGGESCPALNNLIEEVEGLSPQQTAQYMDANVTETSAYFTESTDLTLEAGEVAVIWRDWGSEGAPQGVNRLTETSTQGGYGVWFVFGPITLEDIDSGGRTIYQCEGAG